MKKCKKCNIEKATSEFYTSKRCKDGYRGSCISCHKQYRKDNKERIAKKDKIYAANNKDTIRLYQKQYREDNREKLIKQDREYYANNKETHSAKSKIYRDNNKDKLTKRSKEYYNKNKDVISEKGKLYKIKNRDKIREQGRRRRANKQMVKENYDSKDEQFTRELFNHMCFNCKSTEKLVIDHHKPLSKGNALTRTNAVLLCRGCNGSKHARAPEDFYTEAKLNKLNRLLKNK